MTTRYERMGRAEGDSKLAAFINEGMKTFDIIRLMTMPNEIGSVTYMDVKEMEKASLFYQTCAWDQWLTRITDKLEYWIEKIDTYMTEFEGKWKYFAVTDRLEVIKEYGGEDDDYDCEGKIITVVSDEKLEPYSILSYLYQDDRTDIVLQTEPKHLEGMISVMIKYEQNSITKNFKKIFGQELSMYKQDENGNMVRMSAEEIAMFDVERQYDAAERAFILHIIARAIQDCISKIKVLKYNEDNVEELSVIRSMAQDLLDMNLKRFIQNNDNELLENMMKI